MTYNSVKWCIEDIDLNQLNALIVGIIKFSNLLKLIYTIYVFYSGLVRLDLR